MSSEDGILVQVVGALSRALSPLVDATASPEALGNLLARLGWPGSPGAEVVDAIADAGAAIAHLATDVESGADPATLLIDLSAAIGAIAALEDTGLGAGAGAPFDDPAFWRALPQDLMSLMLSEDLETNAPRLYGVLAFVGALRTEHRPEDPATGRQAYDARVVDWSVLSRTAASPSTWLADVYGWGGRFDHARFLHALAALGAGLGAAVSRIPPHPSLLAPYVAPDNPDRGMIQLLSASPFVAESPTLAALVKPALLLLPLPPAGSPSLPPEGLLLWPMVSGAAQTTVDLGPAAKLALEGDFQATPLRIQLQPSGTTVDDASAGIAMSARADITPTTPFIMVGAKGGARIELTRAHFGLRASGTGASAEVVIDAALDEASAVLDLGGADSFLRGVLGNGQSSLSLATGVTWSSVSGLTFSGSTQPSLTIPTNIRIAGGLTVSEIQVELGQADADAARLTVSVVGGFELGPFSAVVEHMGLQLIAAPATLDAPGNFGLLDLSFGFKPPDGIGLSVDIADAASGGGFLYIAPEKGEYSGVLDVELLEVGVTAIGLISTRLPGEPDGWSMFLSLSASFTALQLGFGFTLNGVGGLVGINRSLDEEALADGVRSGALDSILFPEDPIANAPRILADMAAVFPPAEDQFVFGPVVKLGWGTPTLIEADLGVVIQLPDPLTITLLGSLEALLPEEDAAVVELRVDVAGTANLTEGTLKVDASLRDSEVAGLALSGNLAIRASLLDNPSFLFSFGGFHPAFTSPQGFPTLARLAIGVDTGDELRITLGSYFAVSSSTLQFGAICELWAKAVGFTAEGGTSFDALIIFKPFGFIVSLRAWVSISAGREELLGVLLAGELQGPNRWHVVGLATFRLLGLKESLEVEARFGSAEDEEPREVIDVEALLIEALRDPAAWSVVPVTGAYPGVVLAETDAESLRVHPAGAIEVRQRIVPLQRRIEQYGNAKVSGPDEFVLTDARVGPKKVTATEVEDWFAAAQYWEMKDAERLSAPSFELMPAGVRLEGGGIIAGDARRFTADYEVKVRDPAVRGTRPPKRGSVVPARALKLRSRARARRPRVLGAILPGPRRTRRGPQVAEVTFVDMNVRTGRSEGGGARADRFYVVRERIGRSADAQSLAVVPVYEQELD